ncbi:MAG: DUF4159 domain-containing protein [Gemmatimonadota bacterium]
MSARAWLLGAGLLAGTGAAFSAAGGLGSAAPSGSVAAAATTEAASAAQEFEGSEYTGEFTFVRIRVVGDLRGFGRFGRGREPPWAHDYPRAERNFLRILEETTLVDRHPDGTKILTTDDPELFKYPVAYISEPGFWTASDAEIAGLREWLLKGGFLIADDFRGRDWYQFAQIMEEAMPELSFIEMQPSMEVFDSFFRIESLDFQPPPDYRYDPRSGKPVFMGMFEDNDPSKRLMVIANYNNDIGDYWEWSDAGFIPIDLSNEAYKLGVNYIVYALTH